MRTPQLITAAVTLLLTAALACQKVKNVPSPVSFTIVHAMATGNAIATQLGSDTSGKYWNAMINIYYGGSQLYSSIAGTTPVVIVPITDTGFNIFNGKLPLTSGGIYSLFLSGDTLHADTLLVKDNIPYYADSSVGIRFVNLSIGGKAVTIDLDTSPGTNEFPAFGYKTITDFKKYSAISTVGGVYNFEIRDQATGDSLTTYSWYYTVGKNNTIVIAGSPDPTSPTPLNVFSVNNF